MARKVSAAGVNIQWVTRKNTTAPSAPATGYVSEWWKGGAPWVTRPDGSSSPVRAFVPGGRLTLESGVPISTTDQTAKTTLYYTPHTHDLIMLYDGTADWNTFQFAELSLSLSGYTSARLYDIWAYNNSGSVALESTIWTNSTTRATALAYQNGRRVKSGTTTRLYLGTIYMSATGQTQDANGGRYVVNAYNQIATGAYLDDTANISDATTNPAYAAATATLTFLCLGGESPFAHGALPKSSAATQDHYWRFNLDAGTYYAAGANTAGGTRESFNRKAVGALAAGAHTIAIEWMRAAASGTAKNEPTALPLDNWRRIGVDGLVR